jgi:hypothetical protein
MSDEVNKAESIATIRSPGRPVGSKNKSTALKAAIDAHDPDAISNIVGKTVDAASRGEKWAIELIMDKTVREPERPRRHVRPAAHPFAGGSCARPRHILQATAAGQLSPGEAASLSAMVVDSQCEDHERHPVYLDTVRKLGEANDKQGLMQIKAPYPADVTPPNGPLSGPDIRVHRMPERCHGRPDRRGVRVHALAGRPVAVRIVRGA